MIAIMTLHMWLLVQISEKEYEQRSCVWTGDLKNLPSVWALDLC